MNSVKGKAGGWGVFDSAALLKSPPAGNVLPGLIHIASGPGLYYRYNLRLNYMFTRGLVYV